MQDRSPKECKERYHQNLKPYTNDEPITGEEGKQIERMVAEMGKRWSDIAQRLGNRSGDAVKNWWNGSINRDNYDSTSGTGRAIQEESDIAPAEDEYSYTSPREQFHRDYPSRKQTLSNQIASEETGPSNRISDSANESVHRPLPKGLLKAPRQEFSEDPIPTRERLTPLRDDDKKDIPPGARWTKIDRKLVNPEALEAAQERFEERDDYVIVLRVLTKGEIQELAEKTQEIRGM